MYACIVEDRYRIISVGQGKGVICCYKEALGATVWGRDLGLS